MTSVQSQEDLEARIARIKKRNEEIEQKYREAEEDRLRAMKENAMVEIKPPKDDDWPREHKYDKIDFNYELDENTLAQLEERKKEKNAFIQKIAKEYKGFAEGEGPPPDPAYSFLADVERDGEKTAGQAAGNGGTGNGGPAAGNAPSIGQNGRSPPGGGKGAGAGDHFDRRHPNNRSGHRQGGGAPRDAAGPGGRAKGGGKHHGGHHGHAGAGVQRSFSTNEHDSWRSASGEQYRRGNGRGGAPTNVSQDGTGGHWRRGEGQNEGQLQESRSKDDSCALHASAKLETNLTVSVSRDGEFKSVKVTSPPIIGSGRVGPRQPAKPQFQFHTDHQNQAGHHLHGHHNLPLTTAGSQGNRKDDHFNRNTAGRKSDRGGDASAKKSVSGRANATTTTGSQGKGSSSVQDRLNRNRTVPAASPAAATVGGSDRNENIITTSKTVSGAASQTVSGAAKATLKTISKIIEKNAEIDEQLARELARENEKLATKVKELRLQQEQQ